MPDKMPDFQILVDGYVLPIDPPHLVKLEVEESLEETGHCEITINDSHDFALKPNDIKLGKTLEVGMGWVGDITSVFKGEIITIEPEFPANSIPSLTITAFEPSYKFKREDKTRSFTETDYYRIIKAIVTDSKSNYGIDLVVEPKTLHSQFNFNDNQSIQQSKQTDWEMLDWFAKRSASNLFVHTGFGDLDESRFFLFMVDDNYLKMQQRTRYQFIFNPIPADFDSPGDFDSGKWTRPYVLQEFKPKSDNTKQRGVIDLTIAGTDKTIYAKADINEMAKQIVGQYSESLLPHQYKFLGEALGMDNVQEPTDQGQARFMVQQALRNRLKTLVTGKDATVIGNPNIHIGQSHDILCRGLGDFGKLYSGSYMTTRVLHTINPNDGFITKFDVRKDDLVTYA